MVTWDFTIETGSLGILVSQIHTNSLESMWAMFKRAQKGTFHKISSKQLHRYFKEFVERHNL